MKTRLRFFVPVVACLLLGWYRCLAQEIHFDLVNPPKDAPWSQIVGMSQGPEGFLWIATQTGLYKYDGHQFTAYLHDPNNPNSIADNRLECVLADKKGIIWIGTYLKGLDRLDPATGIITHFHHLTNDTNSISNDTVTSIMEGKQGMLWIGTFDGLNRFNPKTKIFTHYYHIAGDSTSLSNNLINIVYEDHEGVIWVGTGTPFYGNRYKGGGLNRFDRKTGTFKSYLHDPGNPNSITDNRVESIFEDSRGKFWVGTAGDDGLQTLNRATGIFTHYYYDPSHPKRLSRPPLKHDLGYVADNVSFITEDASGRIWIGTLQGGINVYDPSTKKVIYYGSDTSSKEQLATNEFYCAYKTKDGTLWIGSWGGMPYGVYNLYKISPYQNKLPYHYLGEWVLDFTEDSDHSLWMVTSRGLIHKDSAGQTRQFLLDKDTSSYKNVVFCIAKGMQNKLWLGTLHGLYRFDPLTQKFTGYHHQAGNSNSLCCDTVTAVCRGMNDRLWVGTFRGLDLMDAKTGKVIKHFQNNPEDSTSISNNHIRSIVVDKNAVWVGTGDDGGLNRFDRQSENFKRYLSNIFISHVMEDNDGNLWIGTNEGLFKYNKEQDSFSNFAYSSAKISSTTLINGITEDKQKNLWLNTGSEIIKLNTKNNTTVVYGKNHGVTKDMLSSSGYARQNGEILFGTRNGYFAFYPKQLINNVPAPKISITNFLLASKPVIPTPGGILSQPLFQTKSILLGHRQNTFTFKYAGVDFISSGDNHLQYMLKNYDHDWRMGGEDRTAYYFNVPPGHYVFKVKAENDNGLWAEKDMIVIISPPWWITWWAITILVLILIAIIWSIIYYRSLRLIRENKILEEKVNHRTKQLQESLENLKSTQKQLIQSEKMASLGELTAGIAHEIQNPLNFVNNFSEVNTELIDEMKGEFAKGNGQLAMDIANDIKENEEKIIHHGKRADAIVKGMLQHSRISSGKKEPTNINALADEYFRLSYHGMRAKDKGFNATMKTDFDESIGRINVVPQDIGRVLLNLFNNAFYAVSERKQSEAPLPPEGGCGEVLPKREPTVWVSTKRIVGDIFPSGRPGGAFIEIRVKDNGNGIPEKIKDKIFQPFFTTKPTGEGTGLGLSLSYDMIKAHDGEISVNSKEGEGTEFVVVLPG